jgi:short-subunit dehydrogenase
MTNVKGKWALITGASRGLGYRMALCMAEEGCNLVLHSRDIKNTEKVLSEVKALGVEAYSVAAELSDLSQVTAMLDLIENNGTQIDILFNDAGVQIAYRTDPFTTPPEDFSASFVINTIAPAMICYRLLPKMMQRGFGRVINTTSGIDKEPQQAGYSASKAALDKYTNDLATLTDGTDVIVSLVDPGWCRTDLGGPNAFHAPEDAIPGMVVGAFVDDKKSGRLFRAQDYTGLTVEKAAEKAVGV